MSDIPNFVKKDKDKILFDKDGEFIFYVPETYFNKKIAIINGEYLDIFGLLDYTIAGSNGKNNGLHNFRLEYVFTTKPYAIEKVKAVKLTKTSPVQDYRLLKYKKGDEIISNVKVPQTVDYAETFFKMFLYADIPNTIPYDELHKLFPANIKMSGNDYGLNMQLFGMLVSEACRDMTNKTKLFRLTDMKDMTAYQMLPIRDMPKYVSAYTAITSENWDDSAIAAMVNKNIVFSPLERLMVS